jgi:glycosyltransferase involved in cell wall biosynthesis
MKILLACAAFPPHGKGGGPVSSRMIAHSLAANNDLVVVTVSDRQEQWNDGELRVRSIGSPNLYWNYWEPHSTLAKMIWHTLENFNPRAFLRMIKEIRREKPDVIATISIENINVATWFAGYLCRVPIVHFIQSHYLLCWRGSMFRGRQNCAGQCRSCKIVTVGRKLLSSCVDCVTAEAQATLQVHFDHGYFRDATSFVAPAMLEETMPPPHIEEPAHGPLRVGYIGRLTYNKGVHVIAQAAKELAEPDLFAFSVAGDGDAAYLDELKTDFAGTPAAFLGWISPADFFENIDVLLVPSLWREPFGRVCIEAFAAGVPVMASNIGGLAEVVKEGYNGFLFQPGDANQLRELLERLAKNRDQLRLLRANCLTDAQLYQADRVGLIIQQQLLTIKERKRPAESLGAG